MIRVYLCAPKQAQPRAAKIAADLVRCAAVAGVPLRIVSSWHATIGPDSVEPDAPRERAAILATNVSELRQADVVVALTDERWGRETYVEIGRALERGVTVVWSRDFGGLALSSVDEGALDAANDTDAKAEVIAMAREAVRRAIGDVVVVEDDGEAA